MNEDTQEKFLINLCSPCYLRDTCEQPCAAVEKILDNGKWLKEKELTREIVWEGNGKENTFYENGPYDVDHSEEIFSRDFEPGQMISKIFFFHFFKRIPLKSIASILGIPKNEVHAYYSQAKKRLVKLMMLLDARDNGFTRIQNHKSFTAEEKLFLLVKVYGFSCRELAKERGNGSERTIMRKVNKIYDSYQQKYLQ